MLWPASQMANHDHDVSYDERWQCLPLYSMPSALHECARCAKESVKGKAKTKPKNSDNKCHPSRR